MPHNLTLTRIKEGEFPPIPDERRKVLEALAQRPDSDIDLADIALLTAAFWRYAVPGKFYRK